MTQSVHLHRNTTLIFILLVSLMWDVAAQEILKADTIVTNGKIVTMDNKEMLDGDPGTIVEAMAIREGKILAVGTAAQMREYARPGTRIIDVAGKTVIPGLI